MLANEPAQRIKNTEHASCSSWPRIPDLRDFAKMTADPAENEYYLSRVARSSKYRSERNSRRAAKSGHSFWKKEACNAPPKSSTTITRPKREPEPIQYKTNLDVIPDPKLLAPWEDELDAMYEEFRAIVA